MLSKDQTCTKFATNSFKEAKNLAGFDLDLICNVVIIIEWTSAEAFLITLWEETEISPKIVHN